MIVKAPWYVPNTASEQISKHQQFKKKSVTAALRRVLTSAYKKTAN
jgi:hypothetical protein